MLSHVAIILFIRHINSICTIIPTFRQKYFDGPVFGISIIKDVKPKKRFKMLSLLDEMLDRSMTTRTLTGMNGNHDYKWEETEDSYTFWIPAPGIERKNIEVVVENDLLYVKIPKGKFSGEKTFKVVVPKVGNQDAIKAKMDNGILEVVIPYITPPRKRIDISVD